MRRHLLVFDDGSGSELDLQDFVEALPGAWSHEQGAIR